MRSRLIQAKRESTGSVTRAGSTKFETQMNRLGPISGIMSYRNSSPRAKRSGHYLLRKAALQHVPKQLKQLGTGNYQNKHQMAPHNLLDAI